MELDGSSLLALLKAHMDFGELRTVAQRLNVDWDALEVDDDYKAGELVLYLLRRNRLDELVNAIRQVKPAILEHVDPTLQLQLKNSELEKLSTELGSLRRQLIDFKEESLSDGKLGHRVQDILATANRAADQSEVLTARVILPRQEDMDVRLVPSHSLERLEEYRSDENKAYLLIGVFSGAILGILSNWATSESFLITRFSVVLMTLLAGLTTACIVWARTVQQRANYVRQQILSNNKQGRQ
jgi:hypothetical protein